MRTSTAFDNQNPTIVEGLILAAIGAVALKRFLAQTAQVVVRCLTHNRQSSTVN